MNIGSFFRSFNLDKVRINAQFIDLELSFESVDQDAAWELYIEMLTRIVTQHCPRRWETKRRRSTAFIHYFQPLVRFCGGVGDKRSGSAKLPYLY